MRKVKAVVGAALAVGAIAALPAGASAHASSAPGTQAHAAGGDPPPVLPASVRVRITRGQKALDKAGEYVDKGVPDKAINSLQGARSNMYAAWRAAKYGIEHPPPPPADQASLDAQASQDGTLPIYATPEQTAINVLNFQHEVESSTFGLLDDAKGAVKAQLSTTMFAALDRRDSAIAYIAAIPPVDPDTAPDGYLGYDVLMPAVVPDVDDELTAGNELLADGALTSGEKRIVRLANAQITATEATINATWPPNPQA
jgi:hypothetical protein